MKTTYESEALAAVHEIASDLHEAGVMDKRTMKSFDDLCLTPISNLSPEEIREVRVKAHVSQTVFARYLNVSPGVVSQWERGEKHPAGAALKLLTIVRKGGIDAIA